MEHCSAINRSKLLTHTTTSMDLKNIMLNAKNQSRKIKCILEFTKLWSAKQISGCQGWEDWVKGVDVVIKG